MNLQIGNEVVSDVVSECNDVVTECNLTNANIMKKKNKRKEVAISNCVTKSMKIIMQNEVVNDVVTECNDVVTECNLTNANKTKKKNKRRKVAISNCVTRIINVKMRHPHPHPHHHRDHYWHTLRHHILRQFQRPENLHYCVRDCESCSRPGRLTRLQALLVFVKTRVCLYNNNNKTIMTLISYRQPSMHH